MAATNTTGRAPIEAKVQAAGVAGGAAGVILWALQNWIFKSNGVPAGLVSLVDVAIPGILALVAGWLAPHTNRPAAQSPWFGTISTSPPLPASPPMPPAAAAPEPPAAAGPPA